MLAAGMLNDRVAIYAPNAVRGEYGEQKPQYERIMDVRAHVVFNRGTRAINVAEAWMQQQISVTMRSNRVMTDRCRIEWHGRQYQVESLNEDTHNRTFVIVATAIDEGNAKYHLIDC